jgi:hypothetical protein
MCCTCTIYGSPPAAASIGHYRKQAVYRVSDALGKVCKTLGEGFVEYDTRQRELGELYIGNNLFAEYFLSGTRQIKVVVTAATNGDGAFAECTR